MDYLPLVTLIFYSIPESYLIFSFGLVLLGQKIYFMQVAPAVAISVVLSYLVRALPLPFGIHSLIGLIFILIIFKVIFKLTWKHAAFATLLSCGTLLVLENSVQYFITLSINLPTSELFNQGPLLRTLIGWPNLIIMALLTLFIYKKRLCLIKQ
jgi:hypothetical protein